MPTDASVPSTTPAPAADVSFSSDSGTMVHCTTCGTKMARSASACPKCGAPNAMSAKSESEKTMVVAALLCFFFGAFGFHRFYVGKIGTGILMLLTLGLLGIWTLVDLIMIITGSFKDKEGLPLKR